MKQLFCIIFIIFNFFACKTKDDKYNQLENYVLNNFNQSINKKKSFFFFVPNNQCKNCIYVKNLNVPFEISENTFIISGLQASLFSNFKNVYLDQENKMFELAFIDYSNTLIITENSKIIVLKNNIDITNEIAKLINSK